MDLSLQSLPSLILPFPSKSSLLRASRHAITDSFVQIPRSNSPSYDATKPAAVSYALFSHSPIPCAINLQSPLEIPALESPSSPTPLPTIQQFNHEVEPVLHPQHRDISKEIKSFLFFPRFPYSNSITPKCREMKRSLYPQARTVVSNDFEETENSTTSRSKQKITGIRIDKRKWKDESRVKT